MNSRPNLATLWKDRLTVSEYAPVERPNGSTGFEEVATWVDAPCKLSFGTLNSVDSTDTNAPIRQVTKVFCANDIDIPPGSKLTITRHGKTFEYKRSGLPGIFSAHQEVELVPFDGWA